MASDQLPESLRHEGSLRVPPSLLEAYERSLTKLGLRSLASAPNINGAAGGASILEFHQHYATRFRVGVCRAIAALLDPMRKFETLSQDLLTTLAAGRICLLDAPSGPCTASLAFLTTLIELRARNVVPMLPLTIDLHAADISPDALAVAADLIQDLLSSLSAVAITVNLISHPWDASSVPQTRVSLFRRPVAAKVLRAAVAGPGVSASARKDG